MSKHDMAAFPGGANQVFTDREQGEPTQYGMTLRDYFAAAALNRLLAWDFSADMEKFPNYATNAAQTAYAMADAMLTERTNDRDA